MSEPKTTSTLTVPISGAAKNDAGLSVTISGSMTISLNQSDQGPIPGPGISIDRVTDGNGQPITSAVGGSVVYVKGFGMGAPGMATVAGLPVVVQQWEPWQIAVRLPIPRANTTGPVVVTPLGGTAATSKFRFTITG